MTRLLSITVLLMLAAGCSANSGADDHGTGSGAAAGSAGQGGSGWPDAAAGAGGVGSSGGAGPDGAAGSGASAGSAGSAGAAGSGGVGGCPGTEPPDCSPGPGDGLSCVKIQSCFLKSVQNAVKFVIANNPAWFDLSSGSPYVLQPELYMDAVVAEVGTKNVCSIRDPNAGDEIVVKHDNAFAENFDILSAEGYARYGDLIYTSTCSPAWF